MGRPPRLRSRGERPRGGGLRADRRSPKLAATEGDRPKLSSLPYPVPIVPRPRTSLVATAAVIAALSVPGAASAADSPGWAPEVPWGAGCGPAQSVATRIAANCGATLVEGEA